MKKEIKNLPASIHTRLKRRAVETQHSFQELFYFYAFEGFLHRLSLSQYGSRLILKGGLAFGGWRINLRRSTRDIDFNAQMNNSADEVARVIKEICDLSVDDGLNFDTTSFQTTTTMTGAEYEGVRIRCKAFLGKAYIWLQIDISFANVITPKEIRFEYPILLDRRPFELLGYNRETAIAEKFQSMVFLGLFNGRLKDYYDIYLLAKEGSMHGSTLRKAIVATFTHRDTAISSNIPEALSDDFINRNRGEWLRFVGNTKYQDEDIKDLKGVIEFLRKFLLPPMKAAANGEDFDRNWTAEAGWSG